MKAQVVNIGVLKEGYVACESNISVGQGQGVYRSYIAICLQYMGCIARQGETSLITSNSSFIDRAKC